MSKKTYVISVFSFALSLSTIITIMDWFFTAPFIIPKDNIIWYITLTVLILTGAVILIWYKSDRPEKKKRKSRASKGKK